MQLSLSEIETYRLGKKIHGINEKHEHKFFVKVLVLKIYLFQA